MNSEYLRRKESTDRVLGWDVLGCEGSRWKPANALLTIIQFRTFQRKHGNYVHLSSEEVCSSTVILLKSVVQSLLCIYIYVEYVEYVDIDIKLYITSYIPLIQEFLVFSKALLRVKACTFT